MLTTMASTASPATAVVGERFLAVHAKLRAAILSGEINAGAITSQAALAARLGVGRTPLREALRMLQREGLIISEPNHRIRVAGLSSEDVEELYIMRIALEEVAIRLTVPALTAADLAEMEGLMAQMDHYDKTRDGAAYDLPHRAFHQRLTYAAGPRISAEIAKLFDHAYRYRIRYGGLGPWEARRAEHRGILDAAAAHDVDGAAELLAQHYLHTLRLVFEVLEPDHDLARLGEALARIAPGQIEPRVPDSR
jgi:DNA-binding GntR family transcriptional regulator